MRFFTQNDVSHAVAAMLASGAFQDVRLLGTMSGIKRRARARAIVEFAKRLDPAPEDYSITTMRLILQELFGKGVSNRLLHLHFSTPKRKANDRVDVDRLNAWLNTHRERFLRRRTA